MIGGEKRLEETSRHGKSSCKGQQTTPKPTWALHKTLTLYSTHRPATGTGTGGREPAGPLRATPYPHCDGQANLGPPARLVLSSATHLHASLLRRGGCERSCGV